MRNSVSRRSFVAGLCAVMGVPASAKAPLTSLRPVVRPGQTKAPSIPNAESIIEAAKLNGKVSFSVADASNGKLLESRNGNDGVPPASVTKAITALYAMDVLGPGHRFNTRVISVGGVKNGVVTGDLVLQGGGDPTLDSTDLANLALQLKEAGIREVKGRFLVDIGALPQEKRIDADQPDHVGYNPGISGIALNFNRVHFEWRRGAKGYAVTMDARTVKVRPEVAMARMKIVDRNAPVYSYSASQVQENWTVARGALGKDGARWLPIRLPGHYAGDVFRTLVRAHGIVLPKAEVVTNAPSGVVVASHVSAPLQSILRDMLKYSNNLIAEMVGMAASRKLDPQLSSLRASASAMNRWAASNIGFEKSRLVDHSGLNDASKLTAQEMCSALVHVEKQGFAQMLKPFTLRDKNGRPNKSHPIQVMAKTGTLNFVSSLAGYVTTPDGDRLSFAIFALDEKTRQSIPKANRERPRGAKSWNSRAKRMQQALIERWAGLSAQMSN